MEPQQTEDQTGNVSAVGCRLEMNSSAIEGEFQKLYKHQVLEMTTASKFSVSSVGMLTVYMFVADFIVVGSDSGRIVILEYLPAKNAFEKVEHLVHMMLLA